MSALVALLLTRWLGGCTDRESGSHHDREGCSSPKVCEEFIRHAERHLQVRPAESSSDSCDNSHQQNWSSVWLNHATRWRHGFAQTLACCSAVAEVSTRQYTRRCWRPFGPWRSPLPWTQYWSCQMTTRRSWEGCLIGLRNWPRRAVSLESAYSFLAYAWSSRTPRPINKETRRHQGMSQCAATVCWLKSPDWGRISRNQMLLTS